MTNNKDAFAKYKSKNAKLPETSVTQKDDPFQKYRNNNDLVAERDAFIAKIKARKEAKIEGMATPEIDVKLEQTETVLNQLDEGVASLVTENDARKAENEVLTNTINEQKQALDAAKTKIDEQKGEITALKTSNTKLKNDVASMRTELDQAKADISALQTP